MPEAELSHPSVVPSPGAALAGSDPVLAPSRTTRVRLGRTPITGRNRVLLGVVLAVILIGFPMLGSDYYTGLATTALIYVVLATSWNVVGGFGGQLSFGHAAFFGMGGYAAAEVVSHTSLPTLPTVVLSLVAAALIGGVTSILVIPGFRARGAYFAILTLAVAECCQLLGQYVLPGGSNGLILRPVFGVGVVVPYFVAVVIAIAAVGAAVVIRRGHLGKALSAIRSDMEAAASVGINTVRVRAVAFAISAAMAGAAGGLFILTETFIDPATAFDTNFSVLAVLMVILGGSGTIAGPVIGAILWSVLNDILTNVSANGGYSTLLYGLLLTGMAVLLPQGIAGLYARLRGSRRGPAWRRDRVQEDGDA